MDNIGKKIKHVNIGGINMPVNVIPSDDAPYPMNKYIMFIGVMFLLLFVISFVTADNNFTENFSSVYGHNCTQCKGLNLGKCINCSNCGYCMRDENGKSECVEGDLYGPYDNRKCTMWYHHDPSSRELFYRKNRRIKPYA